jgi:uncharacterized protein DUF4158
MIRGCRGDHSRLGYALMLCYLRYAGRPLCINERPPAALISLVDAFSPPGLVLAQNSPAGAVEPERSPVNLTVSLGAVVVSAR